MGGGCQAWSETYPVPVPSLGKAPRLRYQPFPSALLILALFHKLPWCSMECSWYARGYGREKSKWRFCQQLVCIGCLRAFPVAQICPNLHKIDSSYIGAIPVAQIRPNWHKIDSSSIRAFTVAQICPNSHKIVSSYIGAIPVAQICPNLHKIVYSYIGVIPVAQIRPNSHKIVFSCIRAFLVVQSISRFVQTCIKLFTAE